ncbi:MAG: Ig-like domain-containing protein [Bacteroidota bacterium]|nr:Ig-like domain-containing protein [Bacteroidota bacterium]
MLKYYKNHLITTLAIVVILASCAKIVAPTGGPKDTTPPVLVRSTPVFKSTNFKGKEITITFDEFIQPLKDANNQVIFSPPPEKQPELKLKGKSIIIRFGENLKPNSTYNIYFGDAILDLNEGNIKKNFYFTFSTGDKIDTLELRGRVNNAATGLP